MGSLLLIEAALLVMFISLPRDKCGESKDPAHICPVPSIDEVIVEDPHPCQAARMRFSSVEKVYFLPFGRMTQMHKIGHILKSEGFFLRSLS